MTAGSIIVFSNGDRKVAANEEAISSLLRRVYSVRTLVSVTFVSVTGRDACMRAKSCGLFETSCFAPLRSILACVLRCC